MSGGLPEELHVLAGEYVLGALDVAEMRAVRSRAVTDPALAAAITAWEAHLAPLVAAVPPTPPPAALWTRIESAIAPLAEEPGGLHAPPDRLVPMPARPSRPRRVWPWQVATVASLAIAAGLAALIFAAPGVLPGREMGGPTVTRVAALAPPNAAPPAFVATAQPDGKVVLTGLPGVSVPAGKSLELWVLPPGATAPAPLGVVAPQGRVVTLPNAPGAGTKLLISLEPEGGSPTGLPTGPVLYAGSF